MADENKDRDLDRAAREARDERERRERKKNEQAKRECERLSPADLARLLLPCAA
jgi:hypothetical protein